MNAERIIPKPKEIIRALIVSLIITLFTLFASGDIVLAVAILIFILLLFSIIPPIVRILLNVAEEMKRKRVDQLISEDQLYKAVLLISRKVFIEKKPVTYEDLEKELKITPIIGKILLKQLEEEGIIYTE